MNAIADTVKDTDEMLEQLGNQYADQGRTIQGHRVAGSGNAISFYEEVNQDSLDAAVLRRAIQAGELTPRGESGKNHRSKRWYDRFVSSLRPRSPKGYKACGLSFREFCRHGMHSDEALRKAGYQDSLESIARSVGMNTTKLEDGGFLVLPEYNTTMLELLYDDLNLWSRVPEYTIGGNQISFPKMSPSRADGKRHGGFRAFWAGQGKTISETDLSTEETDIKLGMLSVGIFVTKAMQDDAGLILEQWITRNGNAEFSFQLGNALLNGVGGWQPLGLLKSGHRVTVAKDGGQAANTITATNIVNMWSRRMAAQGGDDLVWLINQNCEPQLAKLTFATGTSSGQLVYQPPTGLSGSPYATLQGRPIIPTEFNEVLGTEGDIVLTNFNHYLAIAKGGIEQDSSIHVEFLRNLNCIKFTMRVNGRPAYDEPVTPFKSNGSDTQSSIVTLETRA